MQGVLIGAQADMWDPEKGAAHQAAYEPFVSSVASHTTHLGKPVLMLKGDPTCTAPTIRRPPRISPPS